MVACATNQVVLAVVVDMRVVQASDTGRRQNEETDSCSRPSHGRKKMQQFAEA